MSYLKWITPRWSARVVLRVFQFVSISLMGGVGVACWGQAPTLELREQHLNLFYQTLLSEEEGEQRQMQRRLEAQERAFSGGEHTPLGRQLVRMTSFARGEKAVVGAAVESAYNPVIGRVYNDRGGRGYLILKDPVVNRHKYLVCTQSSLWQKKWLGIYYHYHIESRCLFTAFPFDFFRGDQVDPRGPYERNPYLRSDLRGFFKWPFRSFSKRPIEIPKELKGICGAVFPEAYFCHPTLLVLPTLKEDRVDVCALKVHERKFLTPVFDFKKHRSSWSCKNYNFSTQLVKLRRLRTRELKCVPKRNSYVSADCRAPYVPLDYRFHLVRSKRCLLARSRNYPEAAFYKKWNVCDERML